MDYVNYNDYIIEPKTFQLAYDSRYTLGVNLERHYGGAVATLDFYAGDTFETREEAIQACIQFGRAIIDTRVAGCTPP